MKVSDSARPQLERMARLFRIWARDIPYWLPQAIEEARRKHETN